MAIDIERQLTGGGTDDFFNKALQILDIIGKFPDTDSFAVVCQARGIAVPSVINSKDIVTP